MRMFYLSLAVSLLAPSPAFARIHCPDEAAAAGDPLAFQILYDDDEASFLTGAGWPRNRYEQQAQRLYPTGDPVVFQGLLNQYRFATGVEVEVRLRLTLPEFLAERGIPAAELRYLGIGTQGSLFAHPRLGDTVIKVPFDTFFPAAARFPSNVRLGSRDVHEVLDVRPAFAAAQQEVTRDFIRELYREQARQSLRRAYQSILPGVIAAQARLRYFDFARVLLIGNGFYLREYDPEARDSLAGVQDFLDRRQSAPGTLDAARAQVAANFPPLSDLIGDLAYRAPSFFVSERAFDWSRDVRQRLVILD